METRRLLAVFSVDNLDDSGPGSLRDAIVQANAAEGPDEINIRFYGTIELESQLPTITDSLSITTRGTDRATILDAGNGADGEFGTGDGFRIFDINDGDDDSTINVALSGLTLTGGDAAKGEGAHLPSGTGNWGEDGGAIRSKEHLTIADSVITGNAAGHGADGGPVRMWCDTSTACGYPPYGFDNYRSISGGGGGRGGGVWVENANLTITRSTISGNRSGDGGAAGESHPRGGYVYQGAAGSAGGLGVIGGELKLTGCTISGNSTGMRGASSAAFGFGASTGGGFGGAVFIGAGGGNLNPSVTISSSTISGNRSLVGGGIGANYSTIEIRETTISSNEVVFDSSGISAIYSDLTIAQSTLSNNYVVDTSDANGNAVIDFGGQSLEIVQSTITENSGGIRAGIADIKLQGALIARNGESNLDLRVSRQFATPIFESQDSLIGAAEIPELINGENGNQVGTPSAPIDPRLAPLADNGGPTQTHALLADSPAFNAGDPLAVAGAEGVPEFDQRGEGYTRVAAGRIDIGAYEAPPVLVVNDLGDVDDGDLTNSITTLREAINAANVGDFTTEIRFDPVLFGTPQTIAVDSQLRITSRLVITGPGADLLTLDAGNGADGEFGTGDGHRVFDINDGDDDSTIDVVLSGLTLTGGDARNGDGYDVPSRTGYDGKDGGGIRSRENLSIANSVITGNAAGDGLDGLVTTNCYSDGYCVGREIRPGEGGRGGGVWVYGANLTITKSRITGNRAGNGGSFVDDSNYGYGVSFTAAGSGGGLGVQGGNLTIARSTISQNSTGMKGSGSTPYGLARSTGGGFAGGVFVGPGFYSARNPSVTITSSTISGNRSLIGAGIGTLYGSIEIRDTTINGNEALSASSGISAIYSDLTIAQSTLSGNYVVDAFFLDDNTVISVNGQSLEIAQSTITENSGGIIVGFADVKLQGALIAGNGDANLDLYVWDAQISESRDSLIGAAEIPELINGENGNQVGTLESPIDPRLAPLADNGGPTLTHALLSDSPALNAGDPSAVAGADGVPLYDQRGEGFSRVLDGRIDIGAFEGFVVVSPATSGDFNSDGVVDALDSQAWRATYGATVDPYTGADANGNGRIDAGDYTVWRDNFTPRDVDILQTAVVPIIDGTPDPLWGSVLAQGIGNLVFGSVDSPSDASATWRAVWDETALYLYAEITDQRLIRDSSFAFEDDGLEVFFDADLSRQATYDGVDDTQYMFRLADSLPVGSPDSPADATDGVVYATGSNPNGGGYTIEVAIPWAALKAANPLAGDLFGLEFAMQDDDDGGGISSNGADGRLQWHGTSNQAFRRPSAFGVAALSPRLVQPPVASSLSSEPLETPPAKSIANVDEGFAVLETVRPRFRTPAREPMKDRLADANQRDLLLIALTGGAGEEALELDDKSQRTPEGAEADDAFDAAFAASVR